MAIMVPKEWSWLFEGLALYTMPISLVSLLICFFLKDRIPTKIKVVLALLDWSFAILIFAMLDMVVWNKGTDWYQMNLIFSISPYGLAYPFVAALLLFVGLYLMGSLFSMKEG